MLVLKYVQHIASYSISTVIIIDTLTHDELQKAVAFNQFLPLIEFHQVSTLTKSLIPLFYLLFLLN